jgi:ribonuclease HI
MNQQTNPQINMNNTDTTSSLVDTHIQKTVEKIRACYDVQLPGDNQPIELRVDGLCENQGAMHIGLFASQGETCLFAEHAEVGAGTCNEAEYIAVKFGLSVLRALYPEPKVAIRVFSDSQLVTQQLNGKWHAKDRMQAYCLYLLRFQQNYPFTITKIPRSQNQIADSLAQKYITKNSGRCMTIENGRFNVIKQLPDAVKNGDTFNALTSREFRHYLCQNNLSEDLQLLLTTASAGDDAKAATLAQELKHKAQGVFATAPKTNEMVARWVANTAAIVEKTIDLVIGAIQRGDSIDLHYLVEELASNQNKESDLYSSQIGAICAGMELYQTQDETDLVQNEDF